MVKGFDCLSSNSSGCFGLNLIEGGGGVESLGDRGDGGLVGLGGLVRGAGGGLPS